MKKIGIICAGNEELAPFLSHIKNTITTDKAMLRFYEGSISGVPVVALYSGVCTAIAAQLLIDKYCVDAIINVGTAGGMDSSVELFDTIISTQVAYHDVDDEILTEFHPWLPSIYFHADEYLLALAKKSASNSLKSILAE